MGRSTTSSRSFSPAYCAASTRFGKALVRGSQGAPEAKLSLADAWLWGGRGYLVRL